MRRPVESQHLQLSRRTSGEPRLPESCLGGAPSLPSDRAWPWAIGLLLLSLGFGCSKDDELALWSGSEGDSPVINRPSYGPIALQKCAPEGAVRECGQVHHSDGDYVTCSEGEATCAGGVWSDCVGDRFVIKSAPSLRMTSAGLRVMATGGSPCTSNACDPYCFQFTPDPIGVVASGIVGADGGGVTLEWREFEASGGGSGPCIGLQCQLVVCGSAATTTISGRVYDPAGKNPLYGAEVYIPLYPELPLPPFGVGASCDTCGGAQPLDAIRATQTDANGNFTLSDVPAGSKVPVVVQMGKWRREVMLTTVTSCTTNQVAGNCTSTNPADCVFRLPKNQKDGYDPVAKTYTKADMPRTAIITGSADPFDCLLLKAGIDATEVGDKSSSKRIHLYTSESYSGSGVIPGNALSAAYGTKVNGSVLWNNYNGAAPNLLSYDVVLLPCEGGDYDKQKAASNTPYKNLIDYTNAGGRAFATHYGYSWLAFPTNHVPAASDWAAVAAWTPAKLAYSAGTKTWTGTTVNTQDPQTGTVNTTFPKGAVLSQWLTNVKATSVPERMKLHEGRQDLSTVGSSAQSWMTAKNLNDVSSPTYSTLFTFNAPYGAPAANQCGRVVYSDFHVSAAARTSCPTGGCTAKRSCLNNVDCGFGATCSKNNGALGQCDEPCFTSEDCPNTSFACNGATAGLCEQTDCSSSSDCGTGQICRSGNCTCSGAADCLGGVCSAMTCSPGTTCHSNAQCGSGVCGSGTGATAGTCPKGAICHNNSQCGPTGTCGNTATGGVKGICENGPSSTICHKAADCDSGSCATAGTCAKGPNTTSCHKSSDCDSNVCGSGSGTVGKCSTSAQACDEASDCDSGACGSGTGTPGTCGFGATTTCHKIADCDSGACAGGTCSIGATTTCHKNADCDTGSSGTGLCGTVAPGTCTTSAQACTTNAACDSGSCASRTCNGTGRCTNNSQCTGGATCTGSGGNKRCTGGCSANTDCDGTGPAGGVAGVCGAGTCTTKSCALDTACTVSGSLCNGAKCAAATCTSDAACTKSTTCNGAKCTSLACTSDSVCTKSLACNGATCNAKNCAADTACTVSGSLCNGATCSAAPGCTSDAACPRSLLCNNAKCSAAATCASDAACPSSGQCDGAKCGTSSCGADAQCPAVAPATSGVCGGATCNASTCSTGADCASGVACGGSCTAPACTSGANCASGLCKSGVCACATEEDCGDSQECGGSVDPGSCARNCTTDAQCAPDRCVAGKCGGCTSEAECHSYGYPDDVSCNGIASTNIGTCSAVSDREFPLACKQGDLSPQEKALEFMFFDLTSCVSPDNLLPPKPVTVSNYGAATFVQDFSAVCADDLRPIWRSFDWQAEIPSEASIDFSAQTGETLATLGPAIPVSLGQATTTTNTGASGTLYDKLLIDTGSNTGAGAFNTASPRVPSKALLRVTITLNPTLNHLLAPRLAHWKVEYDCMPAQ